jgi:hypothetical protein
MKLATAGMTADAIIRRGANDGAAKPPLHWGDAERLKP